MIFLLNHDTKVAILPYLTRKVLFTDGYLRLFYYPDGLL